MDVGTTNTAKAKSEEDQDTIWGGSEGDGKLTTKSEAIEVGVWGRKPPRREGRRSKEGLRSSEFLGRTVEEQESSIRSRGKRVWLGFG